MQKFRFIYGLSQVPKISDNAVCDNDADALYQRLKVIDFTKNDDYDNAMFRPVVGSDYQAGRYMSCQKVVPEVTAVGSRCPLPKN
jgi:hypothetical protein